jgi:hypothetical protein
MSVKDRKPLTRMLCVKDMADPTAAALGRPALGMLMVIATSVE